MKVYRILSTVIFLLLSGCGDGDGDSSTPPTSPITTYSVSANDIINVFNVNDTGTIDLNRFTASTDGGSVYLKSLELLSGDAICNNAVKEVNGFSLSSEQDASCIFKYTVMNSHNNSQSAISRTVFRSSLYTQDVQLPPLSLTLEEYQTGVIDVSKMGLSLSDMVTVLGSGTAVADIVNNLIRYTAQEAGITRVLYEMKDVTGVIYLGSVDIAVSQGVNTAPIANNFSFPVSPQIIKPGEEVLIDIKKYISDPDKDVLQLYDVHSFNGVAQIAFPTDLTNTKIKFKSFVPGDFYVSYTVTDHNGGFATSIVKVSVQGFFSSIYLSEDELHFNAPISAEQATQLGIKVSSSPDSGIPGSNGLYNAAVFSYMAAKGFCMAQGGRLPTVAELIKLQTSGKTINYWPTQKYYWSSVLGAESGTYQVVNIVNGSTASLGSSDIAYVTCINQPDVVLPGGVTYELVLPDSMQTNTAYAFQVTYKEADNIVKPFLGDVILTSVNPANNNIMLVLQSAGKYKLYAGPSRGSYKLKFKFLLAGHPLNDTIVTRDLIIDAKTESVVTPPPTPPTGLTWLQRHFDLSSKNDFYCGYRYNDNISKNFDLFGVGYSRTDFAGVTSSFPWAPRHVIIPTKNISKISVMTAYDSSASDKSRNVYQLRVTTFSNGIETIYNCGEDSTSPPQSTTGRQTNVFTVKDGNTLTGITVFYRITPTNKSVIGGFGFETTDSIN